VNEDRENADNVPHGVSTSEARIYGFGRMGDERAQEVCEIEVNPHGAARRSRAWLIGMTK
jgi:hypothetical protein